MKFLRRCVTVPFLVALSLLSACDSDWYRVPICTVQPEHVSCGPAGSVEGDGGARTDMASSDLRSPMPDTAMVRKPTFHPPLTISLTSPIARRWVGVRGNGQIIFAIQDSGKVLPQAMALKSSGKEFGYETCADCPSEFMGVTFNDPRHYIMAGNQRFFLARSDDANGIVGRYAPNGDIEKEIYRGWLPNIRPYVNQANNEIAFLSKKEADFVVRFIIEDYKSYETNAQGSCVAWGDGFFKFEQSARLGFVFDGNKAVKISGITSGSSPLNFNSNSDSINNEILRITSRSPASIDAVALGDLNNDQKQELVLAQLGKVYAMALSDDGEKAVAWGTVVPDSVTPIRSISIADLNKDGHRDLVIELSDRVAFFINKPMP